MNTNYYYLIVLACNLIHANAIVKSLIKSGDLVFDVGAHVGVKTQEYLACGARVICFEPQPTCLAQLKSKFGNNKSVSIEQCGLSLKEDTLTFYQSTTASTLSTFSHDWTHHSRFSEHGYTWDKQLSIPVTTLDIMIAKYGTPQFCKIDVENYEFEVLQGLTKPIPYISFEFTHEYFNKTEQCIRYLEKLGYTKFNVAFGEQKHFFFASWMPVTEFITILKECCLHDIYLHDPYGLWGDVYACY